MLCKNNKSNLMERKAVDTQQLSEEGSSSENRSILSRIEEKNNLAIAEKGRAETSTVSQS